MCGIVGYWDRTSDEQAPVGCAVLSMLRALGCRGPGSAGVAIFGPPAPNRYAVRVKLGDHGEFAERAKQVTAVAESRGAVQGAAAHGPYLRFEIDASADLKKLVAAIEALDPEIEVVSVGRKLEIVK